MKRIISVICAVLLLVCAAALPLNAEIAVETPPDNDFHTPEQYAFITSDDLSSIYNYTNGDAEMSRPRGIVCDFSGDGLPKSQTYLIQKSAYPDFRDAELISGIRSTSYTIYNSYLGEHFYWRAGTAILTLRQSPVHEVTVTDLGPRNCFVEGVTNVRDIGGYKSSLVEGGRIRQGLYYRGANLDRITKAGKQTLTEVLGVKAEIDLRDGVYCKGPFVEGVEYNAISIPAGTESTRFEEFEPEYMDIYEIISNADKKPVYLHCAAGADRTGISTFMLLMVCGVGYVDAARDYLFTSYSNWGLRYLDSEFNNWYNKLGKFEGDTKAEQAKNWMLSKGVPEEQIERIREIFVEGYNQEKITTVTLDNIPIYYKAGRAPSFAPSLPKDALYTVTDNVAGNQGMLEWRGSDGKSFTSSDAENAKLAEKGKLIDKFEEDVTYSLYVYAAVNEKGKAAERETVFARDVRLILDGAEVEPELLYTPAGEDYVVFEKVAVFTPTDSVSQIPGDVNGDGRITLRDVAMMMRAIAGWAQEDYVPENEDFNGDGKFNSRDVALIMRAIAEEQV